MLSIHKLSPMVRAVGTMGAVAALVGGITFAAFTSNTVALTGNTMSTSTAALQISNGGAYSTSSVTGFNFTLTPGTPSSPFTFYLDNTGTIPLTLTASTANSPTLASDLIAQNTTLSISCATEGGPLSATLSTWGPGTFGTPLPAGAVDTCTATATLASSFGGSGGGTTPTFDVDFVGNQ
jgi:hypothetical protein